MTRDAYSPAPRSGGSKPLRRLFRRCAPSVSIKPTSVKSYSDNRWERLSPAIGRPADTRLAMTTTGAAKLREPHRHRAKQRRHPMKPPVLDLARLTARSAIGTQNHVIVGLDGNYRLLQARQDLLRLSQRLPQLLGLAEATRWSDILHIDPYETVDPCFNQAQDPRHPRTPSHQRIVQSYRLRPHPPTFWTRLGVIASWYNFVRTAATRSWRTTRGLTLNASGLQPESLRTGLFGGCP
jgi:hypothetical protein